MEIEVVAKDNKGNRLVICNWKIELYLIEEQYPRSIWRFKNGSLVVRRRPEDHFHRKTQSYGFNSALLHYLKDNGNADMPVIVKIIKSKIIYKTTVSKIIEEWKYLTFSAKGFETQIFYPITKMEIWVK